jgi:hypothetical protein
MERLVAHDPERYSDRQMRTLGSRSIRCVWPT